MIVILSTVFYRGIENEKTVGEVVEALYFATILQVLISGYSENGESNNAVFLNLCIGCAALIGEVSVVCGLGSSNITGFLIRNNETYILKESGCSVVSVVTHTRMRTVLGYKKIVILAEAGLTYLSNCEMCDRF